MSGAFCLMLHSHIPYCKKSGVWPAGEEWLFEAMNECYIPLLKVLRRLVLEGIRPGIAVGVAPDEDAAVRRRRIDPRLDRAGGKGVHDVPVGVGDDR